MRKSLLLISSAALAALVLGATMLSGPRSAAAQVQGMERTPFQQILMVPPDDKDYVVTAIPQGGRVVVTDVIVYNVADGKSHKVQPAAESYLWLGGYVDGKSVALINRIRTLGNETEQWHLQTGLELKGAPDLRVSSEKTGATASSALVYVTGYVTK